MHDLSPEKILTTADSLSDHKSTAELLRTSIVGELLPLIETVVVWLMVGLIFLLPILFFTGEGIVTSVAKIFLLTLVVSVAAVLTLGLSIKQTKLYLPVSPPLFALLALLATYLVSAAISGSFSNAFFGTGTEVTTAGILLILVTMVFIFARFFTKKAHTAKALFAFITSALLVYLFQITHLLSPNLIVGKVGELQKLFNPLGAWSDLGIFSGMVIIFTLITLDKLPRLGSLLRVGLYAVLFFGLVFYTLAPFTFSWLLLAVVALGLVVGGINSNPKTTTVNPSQPLATPTLAVAILSILLVFIGPSINVALFNTLSIPPVQEIKPSWGGTYQTAQGLFSEGAQKALLGSGPNQFSVPWQKYRPSDINYTPWWGIDFTEGVATIPSTLVSVGIIGFGLWLVFLVTFLYVGYVGWNKTRTTTGVTTRYFLTVAYAVALYGWITVCTNSVGIIPLAYAFLFTGLYLGTLATLGLPALKIYDYRQQPQKGFTTAVISLLMLGLFGALGYHSVAQVRAQFLYQKALVAMTQNNYREAAQQLEQATNLINNDTYQRTLVYIDLAQIKPLLEQTGANSIGNQAEFGNLVGHALAQAQQAIEINNQNYQNWLALGAVHLTLLPMGINIEALDSAALAESAFKQAQSLNPYSPFIPFQLARVAFFTQQPDTALQYIQTTLALKNDYIDAYLLWSQIEEGRGHYEEALAAIDQAKVFATNDPRVLFQIGYIQYKSGDYESAIVTFKKTLELVPEYANAKYFLSLSYAKAGYSNEALSQLTEINQTAPENAEIVRIIYNLKNGLPPLAEPAAFDTNSSSTESDSQPLPN
jgi:tetratricopeptide (TPR) repeat protein